MYFALVWMLAALPLNKPALLSIPTMLLAAGAIWQGVATRRWGNANTYIWGILLALPFLFSVLWIGATEDLASYQRDVVLKLSFLLIAIGVTAQPSFSGRQWLGLLLAFSVPVTLTGALSVADYAFHREEYEQMVLVNGSLPIITKLHHIYYGIMLALSILFTLFAGLRRELPTGWRSVAWVLAAVGFLVAHILTSRTGQVALYVGLLTYGGMVVIQKRLWKIGIILVGIFVIFPVLVYQTVPTFRSRVDITFWDIQEYLSPDSPIPVSDLSIGQRFLLMKTALEIYQQHPIAGTGIADIEVETVRYLATIPGLENKDRIPTTPHNQYLEYLAGFGPAGVLLLLLMLGYPLAVPALRQSPLMVAVCALFAVAMLTESLLERQAGLATCLLALLLTQHFVVSGRPTDLSRHRY